MKSKPILPENKVICNSCKKEFSISPKLKRFPDGIHVRYFTCEHCGEKYIFLVTDAELRKQIKTRGFMHSAADMKLRAAELKENYADRVKDLP